MKAITNENHQRNYFADNSTTLNDVFPTQVDANSYDGRSFAVHPSHCMNSRTCPDGIADVTVCCDVIGDMHILFWNEVVSVLQGH